MTIAKPADPGPAVNTTGSGSEEGDTTLLAVTNLQTSFAIGRDEFRAVDGVSFTIDRGQVVGLVGESGSGKSVTALSLLRLVPRPGRIVGGSAYFDGIDLVSCSEPTMRKIRGRRIGMIFQDPQTALNPMLSVGVLITEGLRTHFDVGKREAFNQAVDLLRQVHISDPERIIKSYPHELSGGMKQRVMVAIAVSCQPDLMLADEPTTALDVTVQAQILELLAETADATDAAMMLITHDLAVIAGYTSKTVVMFAGKVVEMGPTRDVFYTPRHPYTAELLRSTPRLDRLGSSRGIQAAGGSEDADRASAGCRYASRCQFAEAQCSEKDPPLEPCGDGHEVACWVKPVLDLT
ncbi:MAG: ABC transporter ATP-binding protein [Acidimicrobiia bacterium]|nr:MAG: ABC transporter ATP-binding protein [Acidimicrobiia bacterium]